MSAFTTTSMYISIVEIAFLYLSLLASSVSQSQCSCGTWQREMLSRRKVKAK